MKYTSEHLWNFMRGLGYYKEYENYAEFREKKFGIERNKEEPKERFEDTLIGKEREEYLELFRESE